MALLDFLKNKKEAEKSRKGKKPAKKAGEVLDEKKAEAPAKSAPRAKTGKGFAFEAVKEPHISEKGNVLSENGQYVFKVSEGYSKNEIKKTVEGIYGVTVLSVNTVKIPAKKRRIGRSEGFKKSYKKAIVKIKEGQKIEII